MQFSQVVAIHYASTPCTGVIYLSSSAIWARRIASPFHPCISLGSVMHQVEVEEVVVVVVVVVVATLTAAVVLHRRSTTLANVQRWCLLKDPLCRLNFARRRNTETQGEIFTGEITLESVLSDLGATRMGVLDNRAWIMLTKKQRPFDLSSNTHASTLCPVSVRPYLCTYQVQDLGLRVRKGS